MFTAPDAAGPRWWAAVEAAQTIYDTLANDPTWTRRKFRPSTERPVARMYDALSNELTEPARHRPPPCTAPTSTIRSPNSLPASAWTSSTPTSTTHERRTERATTATS
jgi:hypothetical protein